MPFKNIGKPIPCQGMKPQRVPRKRCDRTITH
jgi:hypothetical protein